MTSPTPSDASENGRAPADLATLKTALVEALQTSLEQPEEAAITHHVSKVGDPDCLIVSTDRDGALFDADKLAAAIHATVVAPLEARIEELSRPSPLVLLSTDINAEAAVLPADLMEEIRKANDQTLQAAKDRIICIPETMDVRVLDGQPTVVPKSPDEVRAIIERKRTDWLMLGLMVASYVATFIAGMGFGGQP